MYLVGTATTLSYGTNYDNSILVFDSVGNLKNGKIITMGQDITYKFDNNYFIPYNNFTYFFFGGEIYGYNTSVQNTVFTNKKLNVFAMKYMYANKPNQYSCLQEKSVDTSEATSTSSGTGLTITRQAKSDAYNFYYDLKTSTQTNIYAVYSSPYSGAFSLLDTM